MNDNFKLASIYVLSLLALYPIIRYIAVFKVDILEGFEDKFIFARVFLSSPILLICGLILFFRFNTLINRLFGLIFSIIGLLWMIALIIEIAKEAA